MEERSRGDVPAAIETSKNVEVWAKFQWFGAQCVNMHQCQRYVAAGTRCLADFETIPGA